MDQEEYVSFLVVQEPYPHPTGPEWTAKLRTKMYAIAAYFKDNIFPAHIWTSDGPPTIEIVDCKDTLLKDPATKAINLKCTGQVSSEDVWFLLAAFLKLTDVPAFHDVTVVAWDDCGDFVSYFLGNEGEEFFIKRGNVWSVPEGKTMRKALAQANLIASFGSKPLPTRLETRLKPFFEKTHPMQGVFYGTVRVWATVTLDTANLLHQYPLIITAAINRFLDQEKIRPEHQWFNLVCNLERSSVALANFKRRIANQEHPEGPGDISEDHQIAVLYPVNIPIFLVKKLLYEKNRTMPKEFLTRFWALEPDFVVTDTSSRTMGLAAFDESQHKANLPDARLLGTKISYGLNNWLQTTDHNINWFVWSPKPWNLPSPMLVDPKTILDEHSLKMIERLEGPTADQTVTFASQWLAIECKFLKDQRTFNDNACFDYPSKPIDAKVKQDILETILRRNNFEVDMADSKASQSGVHDLCSLSEPVTAEQTEEFLKTVSGGCPDDFRGLIETDDNKKIDLDLEELLINQKGEAALGAEFNNQFAQLKDELDKIGLGDLATDLRRKVAGYDDDEEDDDSDQSKYGGSEGDSIEDEMDQEFQRVKRDIDPHELFGLEGEGDFLTKANQLESINGIGPTKVLLR